MTPLPLATPAADRAPVPRGGHASEVLKRGLVLARAGDFAGALSLFDQAAREPDAALALTHYNRALALSGLGRREEAVRAYGDAIALNPHYVEALCNRANLLADLGRAEAGLADAQAAAKVDPALAAMVLATHLGRARRLTEALEWFDRAVAARPDHAPTHRNRALALVELQQFDAALEASARSVALAPNDPDALNVHGGVLHRLGRMEAALAQFDRAVALAPNHPEAPWNRAHVLLATGDYVRGLAAYEARRRLRHWVEPALPGAEPASLHEVRGRDVLLFAEQGLGDTVQFARFAPALAAAGEARVTLRAPAALVPLLRTLPDVDVVPDDAPAPLTALRMPLMSVPRLLGTTLETLPSAAPYLSPDPARLAHWRERIGVDGFRVGIVWRGGEAFRHNAARSFSPALFADMAALPGVRLFALQQGPGTAELDGCPPDMPVTRLPDSLGFEDTAAIMAHLDLVISACTAPAHVAGALGRPVWVALQTVPDWRWLREREDSPWYPTARLFRQDSAGDWAGVFRRMTAALRARLGLADAPGDHTAWLQRGVACVQAGHLPNALACFDMALAIAPDRPVLHFNRGLALRKLARESEAVAAFERALALDPGHAPALSHLAEMHGHSGRSVEALGFFDRLVAVRPADAAAHAGRASLLMAMERQADALVSVDRQLSLTPDDAAAHATRGKLLGQLGRWAEALPHYERALQTDPERVSNLYGRGTALLMVGRIDEGRAVFEDVRARVPRHSGACWNITLLDMLDGRYLEAWEGYERRRERDDWVQHVHPAPELTRLEDARGKDVFIYHEQGLGDAIQFGRYAILLSKIARNVTLEVPGALVGLMGSLPGVRVVGKGGPMPSADWRVPLMSLPWIFGTTPDTIPAGVPYLAAPPDRVARWRQDLGTNGYRVGVVWRGSETFWYNNQRSFPLAGLAPIAALPGVRLISLQKGGGLDQLDTLPGGMRVETLPRDFDFQDTAAVMQSLDLVISACTSPAHLAGALGRPLWVGLSHVADWRWMRDREDNPWYPSTRLFRQPAQGDWDAVFTAMTTALADTLAARR